MKNKSKKQRHSLLWPALALLALAAFLWWDNNALVTERVEFSSPRIPGEFDGFTIVHLSDLHGKEFGAGNETLVNAVAAESPALIAITGDLIDRKTEKPVDYAASLGAALSGIAPTYYVTGNHEWTTGVVWELKEALRDAGVTVLSTQYVTLERGDDRMVLAGIDDPNGHADQKTPEALATELEADLGDPFWLLLAHRNDLFESQYSYLGADLVLSGHGHGGIFRLPFTDGLLGTQHNFFPSYTAGFYTANDADVFVSRGLGNVGITFRLFNRPEIATLTLHRT